MINGQKHLALVHGISTRAEYLNELLERKLFGQEVEITMPNVTGETYSTVNVGLSILIAVYSSVASRIFDKRR